MKLIRSILMMFVFALFIIACSKKDSSQIITPSVPTSITSLKQLPFIFGFSVNVGKLNSTAVYRNSVITEASSVTAESVMKIGYLHPTQNSYLWTDADSLVNFALRNNIRVHGHTLIWHQSLPSWENLMKTYIQTVVGHFKNKVKSWDVVNEAISNDGTGFRTTSIWYQKLGVEYIARVFQYAHEADSSALLFYNDYGNEWGATKRNAIINLVNDLKLKVVPINGIGMQMHTDISQSDMNIQTAISTAVATGLLLHISELDISLNVNNSQTILYNNTISQLQADKYKMIIKAYNSIPKSQQYGITTWGVGDADSWIPDYYKRPDWPLLFTNTYDKKAAFYGVLSAIQ